MPSTAAVVWVSPSATAFSVARISPTRVVASTEKPSSLGIWFTITTTATPMRYPVRIGLESRSVTNPRRRKPATTRMTPIMIANRPASATARSGSPAARGRIDEAMIGASDESGPSTSTRDGPTTA